MCTCESSKSLYGLDSPDVEQLCLFESLAPGEGPKVHDEHQWKIESLKLPPETATTERRLILFGDYPLGTVERRYSLKNPEQLTGIKWQGSVELRYLLAEKSLGGHQTLHATDDLVCFFETWMTNGPFVLRLLRLKAIQDCSGSHARRLPAPAKLSPKNSSSSPNELISIVLLDSNTLTRLFEAVSELNPDERRLFIGTIVRAPSQAAELWDKTPVEHRGVIPFMLSAGITSPWRTHHQGGKRVDALVRRIRHLPLSVSARICITAGWPRSWYLRDLVDVFLPLMRRWWRVREEHSDRTLLGLMQALELLRRAQHIRRLAPSGALIDVSGAYELLSIAEHTDTGPAVFDEMLRMTLECGQKARLTPCISAHELAQVLQAQAWKIAEIPDCNTAQEASLIKDPLSTFRLLNDSFEASAYRAVCNQLGQMPPDVDSLADEASIGWSCHVDGNTTEWKNTITGHAELTERNLAVVPLNNLYALALEGVAMDHCVLDYGAQADNGTFRAFSIRQCGRRLATLGISLNGHGMWEQYECLGRRNTDVFDEDGSLVTLVNILINFYNFFSDID